jgi:hypothetical protein
VVAVFTVVPIASDDGDEPIPVCRGFGALVGIFPDQACTGSTSAAMAPPSVPS